MAYSKELKQSIFAKIIPPNNQPLSQIQQETGIPEGTLKKWRADVRSKEIAAPAREQRSQQWSTRDKFLIVVETATLNEIELAEYSRKKGLLNQRDGSIEFNRKSDRISM